ncbi:hypothetical protein EYF80_063950 [Liparis tanakae]|uniref:Uncharacterized protein n=1 Tax=Liparis tanakae TaxID=230148 RepID=A0A4Z2EBJ1_9TELE|nr:hypothetical protein EYF80_063950 [Liparis tanakae]
MHVSGQRSEASSAPRSSFCLSTEQRAAGVSIRLLCGPDPGPGLSDASACRARTLCAGGGACRGEEPAGGRSLPGGGERREAV